MGATKARTLMAVALLAAAGATAWLLFGFSGVGGGAATSQDEAGRADEPTGDQSETRAGARLAAPAGARGDASRSGRCEIVGTIRREGRPTAARVEARPLHATHDGRFDASAAWQERSAPFSASHRRPPVCARVEAGADGRYRIVGIAAGEYRIDAAAADGAMGATEASPDAEGARVEANVAVRAGRETLWGRVVHADGQPWKGAVSVTQEASGWGRVAPGPIDDPVATDEDGRFAVRGLARGAAVVSAIEENALRVKDDQVRIPFPGEYLLVIDADLVELAGRVVDVSGGASGGTAIAGADVVAEADAVTGLHIFRRAASDLGGRFLLAVPRGPGSLTVAAEGFDQGSAKYSDAAAEIRVTLSRTARLRGSVLAAEGGRPVEGAEVSVDTRGFHWGARGEESTTTAADGRYAFADRPAGVNALSVSGGGWIPEWRAKPENCEKSPLAVTLVAGQESVVDLKVVRGATATGVVLDSSGAPVAGAVVRAWHDNPGSPIVLSSFRIRDLDDEDEAKSGAEGYTIAPVATATDGTFHMEGLVPEAPYRFSATAVGAPAGRSGPILTSLSAPPRVEIRLPAPRFVVVTVLDDRSGAPVPCASAWVSPKEDSTSWSEYEGGSSASEATDAEGHARVGPLGGGALESGAWAEGYLRRFERVTVAGSDGTGSEFSATVRLTRGLEIAGRVLTVNGKPAAGASVVASRMDPGDRHGAQSTTTADQAGAFRLEDLFEGRYSLEARFTVGGEWRATAEAESGNADVSLTLAAGVGPRRIVFLVSDAEGRPVSSASGDFNYGHGSYGASVVNGRFEFEFGDVGEGDERGPIEGVFEVTNAKGADEKPLPCGPGKLEGVKAGGVYELRLPPEVSISGLVVGPDGKGVSGACASASPLGPDGAEVRWSYRRWLPEALETDATGAFRVGGLESGDHWVRVRPPPGYAIPDPVRTHAGTSSVRFALRPGASPTVTVVDSRGKPAAGAYVSVAIEPPAGSPAGTAVPPIDLLSAFDANRLKVGKDGAAHFDNLDPTLKYSLAVRVPNGRTDVAPFSRRDWDPVDTTVRLAAGLVVSGFVRDAAGRPVAGAAVSWKRDNSSSWDRVGEDGSFRFEGFAPGEVRLEASLQGLIQPADVPQPGVSRTVATGTEGVVLTIDTGLALVVKIENWSERVGDTRSGSPWASLFEEPAETPAWNWAGVDESGAVKFYGLRRGATYTLWVGPDSSGQIVYTKGLSATGGETRVRLAAGKTITGRAVLPPGATNPQVSLRGGDGIYVWIDNEAAKADGTFELRGVPPGTWWVTAWCSAGGANWEGSAKATAGGSVNVEVKRVPEKEDGDGAK